MVISLCSVHRRGIWLRRPIRHECSVPMVVGFTGTRVIMGCARCATKTPYSDRTTAAGPAIQVSQCIAERPISNSSVLASTILPSEFNGIDHIRRWCWLVLMSTQYAVHRFFYFVNVTFVSWLCKCVAKGRGGCDLKGRSFQRWRKLLRYHDGL